MYKLMQGNIVVRVADNAFIPDDEFNADYREYQAWLAQGNQPIAADPVELPIDIDDFYRDLETLLGGVVQSQAVSRHYPDFYRFLQAKRWDSVVQIINDAKSINVITQAQYDQIKVLANQHRIPLVW